MARQSVKKRALKPDRCRPLHGSGKRSLRAAETGLGRRQAIQGAQRCLGLHACESCQICSLFCPDLCITRDRRTGQVRIDLAYCKGCGICASVCPKGAIQMVLEQEGV